MAGLVLMYALTPSALLLPGAVVAPRCRVSPVRLCDNVMPEAAAEAIPAGQLADAWQRDEKAKKLFDVLKGCSVYIVGLGGRKSAVARVLSRRLQYRCYDVNSLICSTYTALGGGGEAVSLSQLVAKEPLEDVEQLAGAVLSEVQQFTRSVFVAWDGAVSPAAFAVMQQGLVVNLVFEATTDDDIALPTENAEETKEAWLAGHDTADVTINVAAGSAADDAAYQVVDELLTYIANNPAKSDEWKQTADAKLEEADKEKGGM